MLSCFVILFFLASSIWFAASYYYYRKKLRSLAAAAALASTIYTVPFLLVIAGRADVLEAAVEVSLRYHYPEGITIVAAVFVALEKLHKRKVDEEVREWWRSGFSS